MIEWRGDDGLTSNESTVMEIRGSSKDHDYKPRPPHRSTESPTDPTYLGYAAPPNSRSCLQTASDNGDYMV